jgi:hypothetical protein
MALTAYAYNFSDTQNGKFDRIRLENQIIYSRNYGFSDFTIVFDRIDVNDLGQTFTVWFKNALPAGEVTTLNAIVAAHRGDPLYPTLKLSLDAPTEFDNRPNIVINPAPFYWRTYFGGAGDDLNPIPPSTGLGEGTPLVVNFSGTGDGYVDIQFREPIFVHDCQAQWYPVENWGAEDKLSLSGILPATVAIVNGSNTGNVNLYPTGLGYNVILPAAGNGTHDVNLLTAVPVPVNGTGYWNIRLDDGYITPSPVGNTDWAMLDIPIAVSYFKNIPMSNKMGVFDIETYKADYFHPSWKIRLSVHKESAGAGTVSGWFMCFRKNLV